MPQVPSWAARFASQTCKPKQGAPTEPSTRRVGVLAWGRQMRLFRRERNSSSYLLAGAAKCENTVCKLAGAAPSLLHPGLSV